MQTVQEIARAIVAREGGFVNDPDDPGGATNYGVTIGTMRSLGLDLDGDGDIDIMDVHLMTADHAASIYIDNYFKRPKIDLLPEAIQASVFDMYVNSGAHAVEILQRVLIEFGEAVAVDGGLGPQTAGAVVRVMAKAPKVFVDAYGVARRNYYYRLGDHGPHFRKFARRLDGGKGGWIKRAEEFISPQLHLSDAEHRARVRAWA